MAVVAALGIAVGGVWLLSKTLDDHAPIYRGKPLYYWVEQVNSRDASASNQANAIVTKEIIPQLTEAMFHDTNDSRLKLALVEKLNGLPGIFILSATADVRRAKAAAAIGEFGPAAKPAIPVLLQALKSGDTAVHPSAVTALGKIGSEPETIIPLLISYLDDNNLNDDAAEALGNFGSRAKAMVPKLV
ncbi:MAG TPA: HEAT repeat domain-containing protein, partial [Verrucomicrobiae bacterium]|nr:HEAT repeat domain-containing protein [Verrucomicrobiae bacterium]